MTVTPLLEARGISMRFPGVLALDTVDFDVRAGEVHALIGENGAGKSTLLRILSGELTDYEGELRIDGRSQRLSDPRGAIRAGIALIPQELQLVTSLPAADNIFLGREPRTSLGLVDARTMSARAAAALGALGETTVAPDEVVEHLEAGQRQLVAIARALSLDARLVIMDEPTASLGTADVAMVEQLVRRMIARGVAVVYVSHRLDEVKRLAHRLTVLRDGRRVATREAAAIDEAEMVRLMVGRQIERGVRDPIPDAAPVVLRVDGVSVADPDRPEGFRLRGVSFDVRRGEIVGLAGLVGAGRTDFLLALASALDRPMTGRVFVEGREIRPHGPADARDAGLVLLPEERQAQAIFPSLDVRENVTIAGLERVSKLGWVFSKRERDAADARMRETGVRAASAHVPIVTLSGGNQQKAVLARCLFASPTVLLLDEPTRGIDLAAKAEIAALLSRLAAEGFGVVLCSSDLPEILTQCHRVVVFREGRVAAVLDADHATEERVMAAAAGPMPVADHALTSDATRAAPPRVHPARRWLARHSGVLGLIAVFALGIVFSPTRGGRPVFVDVGNLTDILRQVSEKGILAVGMTAVIITGGIDLSVGSVLALAATLSALLLMNGVGLAATLLIVVVVGALWGLLNGEVVARWRLQPFIATLATMSAARGVARYLSGGTAIPLGFGEGGAPEAVRTLGGSLVPYVPVPALIFLASVLAMHVLLARTRSGRYLYAIGDNETAARLSGVRVAWHKASVYVISGALAAVAGILHAAQLEQGNPNDGVAYELDAIAAVVIGGTSLRGGTGTALGTLVGVLIIGMINNIMGLNNVDANLQLVLKGILILGAVWLQRKRT